MSKARWKTKPGNADYDRGAEPLERVQAWRKNNPGYWRRKSSKPPVTSHPASLFDVLDAFALRKPCGALQNVCPPQLVALLGLIVRLQGDALRKTIADEIRDIMLEGYAILDQHKPQAIKSKNTASRRRH